jgi:hypothetical protein
MRIFLLVNVLAALLLSLPAAGQSQSTNQFFRERRFLFEVKQLDEFFERFNDSRTSFIRQHIRKYYPSVRIDRKALLNTLFDNESTRIRPEDRKQFIEEVNNPRKPFLLQFGQPGWFAEVTCRFVQQGKSVNLTLIMEVVADSSGASQWMIRKLSMPGLPAATGPAKALRPAGPGRFLSPMSHTTNFSALARAFDDGENIVAYLHPACATDPTSLQVLEMIRQRRLQFQFVQAIQYAFAQVPGWQFKVASRNRDKSVNNGWLIVDLSRSAVNSSKAAVTSTNKASTL